MYGMQLYYAVANQFSPETFRETVKENRFLKPFLIQNSILSVSQEINLFCVSHQSARVDSTKTESQVSTKFEGRNNKVTR